MIKKYTPKPITVEAVQWTGDNWGELKAIVGEIVGGASFAIYNNHMNESDEHDDYYKIIVITIEYRKMVLGNGDWIVKDENGYISVCTPYIFAKRYQ